MRSEACTAGIACLLLLGAGQGVPAQSVVAGIVRNGGSVVGNAAVYLIPLDAPVTPTPGEGKTIDQVHLSFVPNVAVITPGTEVSFVNSDDVLHNVFGPGLGGMDDFDLGTYPRGVRRSWVFDQEGLHIVLCHIHPEMAAFIIVAGTQHRAYTGSDGSFAIEGVPPGRYRLHAWHPRHWRNERTEELLVTRDDLTALVITLGGNRDPLTPQP